MTYVVLARKWRPAQFPDIVGQGPVVRTLMNAIQTQRIHHAYLLTGSRGIGKTSIARIFAKAIRCENARKDGEWLRSCGDCANCKEIASGTSVDVIEIDGASNNGVDAVREIRENAKYLPASGSKKIYIIDEVHMLTTAAFNALLKTLEEPPPHVIFVLATTEPHKIPGTILSRCQRFDLKRVTVAQVQARLAEIAQAEKIQVEPAALALLARAAEGSMRDALSLFDQVISFAGEKITAEAVRESVGLIHSQTILGILRAVFTKKPIEAIRLVDEAYQAGHDLKLLNRSLIEFLHAAVLTKIGAPHSGLLELNDEEWKELEEIAKHRSLEEIELFFQALQTATDWIGRSPQPKIVLEVVLIKCATADALVLLGGSDSGNGGGLTKTSAPSRGAAPAKTGVSASSSESAPKAPAASATPSSPASGAPIPSAPSNEGPKLFQKATPKLSSGETIASPAYTGPRNWEAFLTYIRPKRPFLASILSNAICDQFPSDAAPDFIIAFSPADAYSKVQLESKVYLDQLGLITREFFGSARRLVIEIREGIVSTAQKRESEREKLETDVKTRVANHPVIKEARSLFGGELGPIEILQPKDGKDGDARTS